MSHSIPDFTESERQLVYQTLLERFGRAIPLAGAEAEIQLEEESEELTPCPVIYWEDRGAHFVIFKLGDARFRAQFFYSEAQQYGTGIEVFDSLGDCVVTLLQVQSEHERQMKGMRAGLMAVEHDDDYHGPVII